MSQNFKFAVRQLAKSPGFAATAILTLALGIGACTAMFSVARAVLLKPLPFSQPERLVWIENVFGGGLSGRTSRADVFNGWVEQSQSFESLGAYFAFSDYTRLTLTDVSEPSPVRNMAVSGTFLPTLGVTLLHGRNFNTQEIAYNGTGAVILSHSFWRQRFNADPGVVGRVLTFNNRPKTVIGVLPASFDFDAVFTPGNEVDVLTAFPLTPETARQGNTVFGIGRLKPGVSVPAAQAELTVISERLRATIVNSGRFGAQVQALDTALRGKFRPAFSILAVAVACVLAIACVNLSNLLLARMNARRQEFTVRIALGAGRSHLVRQVLTESLLLAFAGASIGVPLALWATSALARIQTFGVPLIQNASVDPLALGVTVGLTTIAGLVCGLLPALYLTGAQKSHSLQNATHQRTAGRSSAWARGALVVTEVALACVLLVGAGLLFRSFDALLKVELGFQPEQAMAWRIEPPRQFKSLAEATSYLDTLVERVAAVPGVEAAGISDTLPLGRNRTWGVRAQGVEYPPGTGLSAYPRMVDHQYLQAMEIPLRAGRYFDRSDSGTTEKVAIVNESLARQLWPDRDPIGQTITQNAGTKVVGVVANVRHGSLENAGANEMYFNYHQLGDFSAIELVVRSALPAATLAREVRTVLASHDPALPTGEFYPLERLVDNAVAPRRLTTQLLTGFSTLALILAGLGLYGVIAYSVVQRTPEIGIRMALGAQRSDVLGMIFRGGMKLVLLGVGIGLLASLAVGQVLKAQLFGVSARDPVTFVAIAVVLLAMAAFASVLPALRATKVDPMIALRAE